MTNTGDEQLEAKLGHRFSRPSLLERALMHSSAGSELRAPRAAEDAVASTRLDNEQLEFLGDAVLDMLASEFLISQFPDWTEGQLSKSRASMVNAASLYAAAQRLDLGAHLRLGRGEEKTGGREKPALLADAFEAIIAAVYLDAGLDAARDVLRRILLEPALEDGGDAMFVSDRKSALQEFLQGRGEKPADYRLAGEEGPDHRKTFRVEVWIGGELMATGEGSTKKQAEQRAARGALERLVSAAVRG